jgi:hypothetical protein
MKIPSKTIVGEGRKRWKSTNVKGMALLLSVCTISCNIRANASENHIHG